MNSDNFTKRRHLPNLTGLRSFDAVCRAGSVSLASKNLGVTPGAISRQISQLEASLGCLLFARASGRLALTEVGKAYAGDVAAAFDTMERATQALASEQRADRLVISCSPSFHLCWLLARLPLFEAAYKDIEVVVHTELSTHAKATVVDAIIGVGYWPQDRNLIQAKFMGNYSGPVMVPALVPKSTQNITSPFSHVRHLTLRKQPYIWQEWYEESGTREPATPDYAEFDHMFLTIEAAKAGLGAAIAPYSYVAQDIKAGRLVAPFGFIERKVPYYFARSPSVTPKSALKYFSEWLKSEGRKTPAPI